MIKRIVWVCLVLAGLAAGVFDWLNDEAILTKHRQSTRDWVRKLKLKVRNDQLDLDLATRDENLAKIRKARAALLKDESDLKTAQSAEELETPVAPGQREIDETETATQHRTMDHR